MKEREQKEKLYHEDEFEILVSACLRPLFDNKRLGIVASEVSNSPLASLGRSRRKRVSPSNS